MRIYTGLAAALAVLSLGLSSLAHAGPAAIAAPDRFGAAAAKEILKKGGNAVDAAVAEAFALAVTYPEAGNLGGGGFMTIYIDGKPYFLDYRETAPAAASRDMYLDGKGEPTTALSIVGGKASGTPGAVRGLAEAHRRFGKLTWREDLAPAIRFARRGFVVHPDLAESYKYASADFKGLNFDRYFSRLRAGKLFRQPELAATLTRIAKRGPDEFYTGKTSDLIVAQMGRSASKGLITKADLAAYKPVWREPIQAKWREFSVITAPPPSSGGIALLQLLQMKAAAKPLFDGVALNSPRYMHLVSEIEKRVFADRAEYLGDPDFVKTPVSALIAPDYAVRRAAEINPDRPSATPSVKPGLEHHATTHFSILDANGNAVSNTYTLNGSFGSGVVVKGAGFLMNNEMDDFSVKPGAPNMFGVVGGASNAITPGKRPLSSMTPTILVRDGKVAMVIGTPGGSRIFTSVFQVLADVYDYGLSLPEAQKQLRFHHQLLPENTIFSEPYAPFSEPLKADLAKLGYRFEDQGYNGDIEAIQVIGDHAVAASDPRGRGVALVVR